MTALKMLPLQVIFLFWWILDEQKAWCEAFSWKESYEMLSRYNTEENTGRQNNPGWIFSYHSWCLDLLKVSLYNRPLVLCPGGSKVSLVWCHHCSITQGQITPYIYIYTRIYIYVLSSHKYKHKYIHTHNVFL